MGLLLLSADAKKPVVGFALMVVKKPARLARYLKEHHSSEPSQMDCFWLTSCVHLGLECVAKSVH